MSMEIVAANGDVLRQPLFPSSNRIESIRVLLGSTKLELKTTHHGDGSTTLDVHLQQHQNPDGPCSVAGNSNGVADTGIPLSPSLAQLPPAAPSTVCELGMRGPAPQEETQIGGGNHGIPPTSVVTVTPMEEKEVAAADKQQTQLKTTSNNGQEEEGWLECRSEWLKERKGWLMLLATLFAQMAYQAALNPPVKIEGHKMQTQNSTNTVSSSTFTTLFPNAANTTAGWDVVIEVLGSARSKIFYFANFVVFAHSIFVIMTLLSGKFLARNTKGRFFYRLLLLDCVALLMAVVAGSTEGLGETLECCGILIFNVVASFVGLEIQILELFVKCFKKTFRQHRQHSVKAPDAPGREVGGEDQERDEAGAEMAVVTVSTG